MVREIDCAELARIIEKKEPVLVVDVREPWEHAIAALPESVLIPLGQLAARTGEIVPPEGALVVTLCHHGVRSLHAAAILAQQGIEAVSLAGGIDCWSRAIDPRVPRY